MYYISIVVSIRRGRRIEAEGLPGRREVGKEGTHTDAGRDLGAGGNPLAIVATVGGGSDCGAAAVDGSLARNLYRTSRGMERPRRWLVCAVTGLKPGGT